MVKNHSLHKSASSSSFRSESKFEFPTQSTPLQHNDKSLETDRYSHSVNANRNSTLPKIPLEPLALHRLTNMSSDALRSLSMDESSDFLEQQLPFHPPPPIVPAAVPISKAPMGAGYLSFAGKNESPFAKFPLPPCDKSPEGSKLPGVLGDDRYGHMGQELMNDDWFERKLQKLMAMKLELAKTRLEGQQERAQDPQSVGILDGMIDIPEEGVGMNDGPACMVRPPEEYTKPFCDFLTENPTVFHAVDYFKKRLTAKGFTELSERSAWSSTLKSGGKYFVERNGSSLIAFTIGDNYACGNGVAMIAGHVDALTTRLKPVSAKKTTAGYIQLGVAPYAGGMNATWWDRDLGIGGRVLVKDSKTGKITSRLVKLGWPIARIPTLAPHFGLGMFGQLNAETQAVPIIGLDNSDIHAANHEKDWNNTTLGGAGTFAATQPPKLVRAIAGELQVKDSSSIVNWELELYDVQPAQVGGLDKEFIFAGRVDDKLCSWSAMEALMASNESKSEECIKLVGVFDDEEIGSLLRQGARGNFLPSTIERICEAFCEGSCGPDIISQTYANSFLVSADVTHAVNPNFLGSYLENHAPRLNVGVVVTADSNGHMTTDSLSTALLTRIAEKSNNQLQVFMIRNDSRSGGTVGPMLSSAMGVRAIDAGIPQLSMHSVRATTGSLDPGLGVKMFTAFFDHYQDVDKEFK